MEADILANPFRTHPFASLREIARSLSAAWDLDTTLDLIARKTTEVMGVNSCTIYLLDTDNQTLRLRASTGLARQALGRATLQIGEGMTGHAVARNRPIYAAEPSTTPISNGSTTPKRFVFARCWPCRWCSTTAPSAR